MLHKNPAVIAPTTFTLIQQLQSLEPLKSFYLVGGTALALQLGHRTSIDIDLFTQESFNAEELRSALSDFKFSTTLFRNNTVLAIVNNIKTDFIRHNYPLLKPPVEEEGIRMLSMDDIAAMKVHAIVQSGKRMKDFIDVYFLLQHLSMHSFIELFTQKYNYISPMVALKALNYFGDIDENIDPPRLVKPLPLPKIKKRLSEATLKPNKIFS